MRHMIRFVERGVPCGMGSNLVKNVKVLQYYDSILDSGGNAPGWTDVPLAKEGRTTTAQGSHEYSNSLFQKLEHNEVNIKVTGIKCHTVKGLYEDGQELAEVYHREDVESIIRGISRGQS